MTTRADHDHRGDEPLAPQDPLVRLDLLLAGPVPPPPRHPGGRPVLPVSRLSIIATVRSYCFFS